MRIAFILCDALRYDYYEKYMSGVREYAAENVEYTNCNSMGPNTLSSLRGLLRSGDTYSPDDNMIRTLQKWGYLTTLIHSNPMLYTFYIFDKHLDVFKEEYGSMISWVKKNYRKSQAWKIIRRAIQSDDYNRAENMLNFSKEYIETTPDDSLTWIHLMDTHIPWRPVTLNEFTTEKEYGRIQRKLSSSGWKCILSEEEEKLIRILYAEEVKYLDRHLSKFVSELEVDLVIITADHGDLLGEYGRYSHNQLFVSELLHVPLIIKNGSKFQDHRQVDHRMLNKFILGSACARRLIQ